MNPTVFNILWVCVLVIFGGLFVVLETAALTNKQKDDTLSERLRDWFHTNTKVGRIVWLVVWIIFAGWFAIHIAIGQNYWF